jgi:hypothetical protein
MGSDAANPMKRSGIFRDQLGQAIVSDPRKFRRLVGPRHGFHGRRGQSEELAILAEFIHHAEARIQIRDGGHVPDPLAHVFTREPGIDDLVRVTRRKKVIEKVDLH